LAYHRYLPSWGERPNGGAEETNTQLGRMVEPKRDE